MRTDDSDKTKSSVIGLIGDNLGKLQIRAYVRVEQM